MTSSTEPRDQFHQWFTEYVDQHAPVVAAKAARYGSNSLAEMGRMIARAQHREVDDATALELGCFAYAHGKLQRVADAIYRGESPDPDSWHDALIYAAMAQYIRKHGVWP